MKKNLILNIISKIRIRFRFIPKYSILINFHRHICVSKYTYTLDLISNYFWRDRGVFLRGKICIIAFFRPSSYNSHSFSLKVGSFSSDRSILLSRCARNNKGRDEINCCGPDTHLTFKSIERNQYLFVYYGTLRCKRFYANVDYI